MSSERSPKTSLALIVVSLMFGCGDDDDTSTKNQPAGPAALQIQSVAAVGGPAVTSGTIQLSCPRALSVSVSTTNFDLRTPGTCGALPQCGYLGFSVEPKTTPAIARTSVIPSVVLDLSALEGKFETATAIRVDLLDTTGKPFKGADGNPITSSVSISLSAAGACALPGFGGAGGMAGASGAAGSAGSSGADAGSAGAAGNGEGGAGGSTVAGAGGVSGSAGNAGFGGLNIAGGAGVGGST